MYKILANVHNYKKRIPFLFLQLLLFRKLRTRTLNRAKFTGVWMDSCLKNKILFILSNPKGFHFVMKLFIDK